MERIGVYGHSTGGRAAIQFAALTHAVKPCSAWTHSMRPVSAEVIENGISQPSFFMFSQGWTDLVDARIINCSISFIQTSQTMQA
jgi:hypothetical protein